MKDEPPQSSTASRIISGSVGSMIYVTAFAPLEVVKIRQQASRSTGPLSAAPPSSSAKALLRERGAVVLSNGLVVSRLFGTDAAAPSLRPPRGGVMSALRSIARNEGAAGLYAGLRPTLLAAVPNAAVYLSAYDEISSRLRRAARRRDGDGGGAPSGCAGGRGDRGRQWIPAVAGASARLMSSVATGEFDALSSVP